MVKTVTLAADTPQKVTFEGAYPYYWIDNKTASDVYTSVGGTPEADKDDTYTITAGSQLRISGGVGNNGITLLGEGKVQIIASTIAACPFKSASEGGGIKSVNGLVPTEGEVRLTQSLIPSDGTAYQMPYYIQTGTVTLTTKTAQGIHITFPTPFKSIPTLLLSIDDNGFNSSHKAESVAFDNLDKIGVNIRAWMTNNDNIRDLSCTVHWAAFGEIEV